MSYGQHRKFIGGTRISQQDFMLQLITEIHDSVVKKRPASAELTAAAIKVCQIRYSDAEWDDLNAAIGELIAVLQKAGVKFNNPRIGE